MARVHTGESVLARAVRIVESFHSDDSLLTVSEIARRSGLHLSTTSRLIDELVGCGWLERENRRVRIGVRLWEVASRASPTLGLREAAMPFMEDLHSVVGQHTQLGVLEGDEVLFIERLSAPGAVVNYTRIAGRMPLHASSSGLVLLAHGPAELQERILREPLKVFTDRTIRTERQLRTALADVRKHGYILCAGHIYPNTTGVAVPIRDPSGRVLAALSVVVPNEMAYAQIPALKAAARGISRVMADTVHAP
ncbi:IclR family transcriptional regulator [Rhodococcus oxybenzonivorans]|uniref:IclR family transcriptional regulator n=1 Tax=Rhodococcus TaxID=1827 RepID=UPI00135C6D51|nr:MULTISPECIES: IclR family transcriptional regulator [Rhodococcus]MDV7354698.1 IclR family transcriptional regulator [Rhodococcus oxybenzonivorans]